MVDSNNLLSLIGVSTMVTADTGFPDPDNPSNEIRATNDVILVTDDEEDSDDQETVVLDEYQPLATEDTGDLHQTSSDDEAGDDVQTPNSTPSNDPVIPPITTMEEVLVKEVWASAPPKAVDIEMDSKRVDEVKQVMQNITLPQSSIPEWAANVPEDEWKNQLMKRLQNMRDQAK